MKLEQAGNNPRCIGYVLTCFYVEQEGTQLECDIAHSFEDIEKARDMLKIAAYMVEHGFDASNTAVTRIN